jgi:3-dehydroquinate synthetase
MQSLVAQAVQVKIAIVQEDPFETGRGEVLKLGHTFAHAFEHVDADNLIHGEAVAVGIIAAMRLSVAVGGFPAESATRIERLVERLGLPTALPRRQDLDAVVEAMDRAKERRHGRQRLVLLHDIGDPFVSDDVSEFAVRQVLESVQP